MTFLSRLFSVSLTACLLILSFPKTEFWPLAWLGLVPLLLVIDAVKSRAAFGWSYLCGLIFFTGTIYWVGHVTVLGVSLMIAYLALYYAAFGWCAARLKHYSSVAKALLLPSVWVALEFARAHMFSGFSWASIGLSQYKLLPMIQVADITGFYGVSFLVIFVNVGIAEAVKSFCIHKRPLSGAVYVLSFLLLLGSLGYGFIRLVRGQDAGRINVTAVQGNIDLETRWNEQAWFTIIDKYRDLSAGAEGSDMIVWPETSFPGFLWDDELFLEEIRSDIDRTQTPVLLGAVLHERMNYFNSAVLLGAEGSVLGTYRKIHLVPYGEYIPFRKWMPFLEYIVPIDDFSSGKEIDLLPVPGREEKFGVLICFEDTVGHLTRKFAKKGAAMFVNITNDAWFKDSKGLAMHLQSSVFRSIENRRSLVRVANTGISAFIDPYGRITSVLRDDNGRAINVAGHLTRPVGLREELTFYSRFGDVFAWICTVFAAFALVRPIMAGRVKNV